jgi:anti-sigma factor RsiW
MNCRECTEFLSDYVDDQLDAVVRQVFELHLTRCTNCATYLEQFRLTVRAEQVAFSDADEECMDLPDELVQAILAARNRP